MFYEEQVRNGVLCHRRTPNGKWIPFTIEALTITLTTAKGGWDYERMRADKFRQRLEAIRKIINEN